jgi:hypothetical protein
MDWLRRSWRTDPKAGPRWRIAGGKTLERSVVDFIAL